MKDWTVFSELLGDGMGKCLIFRLALFNRKNNER